MSFDDDYQNRVLVKMKEASFESRMFAATFTAGAEDGSGTVAKALLELLEDRDWTESYLTDPHFGIMIGRALVGLASASLKAKSETTRNELLIRATTQVDEYIDADDFQIHAHAVFARKLLRGEEPINSFGE